MPVKYYIVTIMAIINNFLFCFFFIVSQTFLGCYIIFIVIFYHTRVVHINIVWLSILYFFSFFSIKILLKILYFLREAILNLLCCYRRVWKYLSIQKENYPQMSFWKHQCFLHMHLQFYVIKKSIHRTLYSILSINIMPGTFF